MIVLVEIGVVEEELPEAAPATELLVAAGGGRTPLEMDMLPEPAGVTLWLVVTEVRVSGHSVVVSATTEVAMEAEPESGQSETEDAQL